MTSFVTEEDNTQPSNEDVIRTQIESVTEIILNKVQDRVCTEAGYLAKPLLKLGSEVLEKPVWGIDTFTRKLIQFMIENKEPFLYDEEGCKSYIEKKLLPAINAQEPSQAHNMIFALNSIIEVQYSSFTVS